MIALSFQSIDYAAHLYHEYWMQQLLKEGIRRIKDEKGPNPRLFVLSDSQKEELKGVIQNFFKRIWDDKILSDYIRKRFYINLKVRRHQYLFHEFETLCTLKTKTYI